MEFNPMILFLIVIVLVVILTVYYTVFHEEEPSPTTAPSGSSDSPSTGPTTSPPSNRPTTPSPVTTTPSPVITTPSPVITTPPPGVRPAHYYASFVEGSSAGGYVKSIFSDDSDSNIIFVGIDPANNGEYLKFVKGEIDSDLNFTKESAGYLETASLPIQPTDANSVLQLFNQANSTTNYEIENIYPGSINPNFNNSTLSGLGSPLQAELTLIGADTAAPAPFYASFVEGSSAAGNVKSIYYDDSNSNSNIIFVGIDSVSSEYVKFVKGEIDTNLNFTKESAGYLETTSLPTSVDADSVLQLFTQSTPNNDYYEIENITVGTLDSDYSSTALTALN